MADYKYKGYTAQVTEVVWEYFGEDSTYVSPYYLVSLRSEFNQYKSEPCTHDEATTIRHMYIKWFESAVDKHLNSFK